MTAVEITSVPMTSIEEARLVELEQIVDTGNTTFVAVGNALAEISAERLYRCTHDTFEAYVKDRFGISRSFAYRTIEGAKIASVLSPMGDIVNERQARELVGLEPDDVVEVFQRAAVETGGRPTAKAIREARLPFPTPSRSSSSTAPSSAKGRLVDTGQSRRIRLPAADPMMDSTVDQIEIIADSCMPDVLKLDDLSLDRVDDWCRRLDSAIRQITTLKNALRNEQAVRPSLGIVTALATKEVITLVRGAGGTSWCGYEWQVGKTLERLAIRSMPDKDRTKKRREIPTSRLDDLCAALEADGHLVEVVVE